MSKDTNKFPWVGAVWFGDPSDLSGFMPGFIFFAAAAHLYLSDGSVNRLIADSYENLDQLIAHVLDWAPADDPDKRPSETVAATVRRVWIGDDFETALEYLVRASKATERPDGSVTFTNGRKVVGTVAGQFKPDYSLPTCAECGRQFQRPTNTRGRPTIYCGADCLRVVKRRQGREATRRHRERQGAQA
jgi:hypothetical protein